MPFMTIPEAAILWHISVSELRELCENHMISALCACISAGLSRKRRPAPRRSIRFPEP